MFLAAVVITVGMVGSWVADSVLQGSVGTSNSARRLGLPRPHCESRFGRLPPGALGPLGLPAAAEHAEGLGGLPHGPLGP